jgi:hypothetical protein
MAEQVVRVLETNPQLNNVRQYFIHYVGWKSKWDKWVNASELLKVRFVLTNESVPPQLKMLWRPSSQGAVKRESDHLGCLDSTMSGDGGKQEAPEGDE